MLHERRAGCTVRSLGLDIHGRAGRVCNLLLCHSNSYSGFRTRMNHARPVEINALLGYFLHRPICAATMSACVLQATRRRWQKLLYVRPSDPQTVILAVGIMSMRSQSSSMHLHRGPASVSVHAAPEWQIRLSHVARLKR